MGCRHTTDQDELTRFVLVDSVLTHDPDRTLPGRGVWLHPSADCLQQAARRGGFARSLRRSVDVTPLLASHWPDGATGR
ncbi:YlxR family protein [Aestuariimicrobium sp. Y1814]|uniref:YlxR family protein n=1 Tax=Aestuariimicrobium sp. Y1814 TaxID=3418742 RepID=UPI003DA749A6